MYPIRVSRNTWTKTFYKEHICSEACNSEYEIKDNDILITYKSGCLYPEKIEPLVVHISEYSNEVTYVNEIVPIPKKVKFHIDYPLKNPVTIEYKFDNEEIKISHILKKFDEIYKDIYKEEEEKTEKKDWEIPKNCEDCKEDNFYSPDNLDNFLEKVHVRDIDCSICFDTLQEEDTFKIKNCTHFFHKECIIRWFNTSKADDESEENQKSNSCPVCRKPIILCEKCNSKRMINIIFNGSVPPFDSVNLENPDRPETDGPYKIHTLYYEELFFKGVIYEKTKNIIRLLPFEDLAINQE